MAVDAFVFTCTLHLHWALVTCTWRLQEHAWVTEQGATCLPSEAENCRLIEISDDDIRKSVTVIPKLETLVSVLYVAERDVSSVRVCVFSMCVMLFTMLALRRRRSSAQQSLKKQWILVYDCNMRSTHDSGSFFVVTSRSWWRAYWSINPSRIPTVHSVDRRKTTRSRRM